ncbi:MAG: hypothetical protein L6R39_000255 [Caloplaca ligustica]|nr:MAG: hypothetical protein L6R39_000255 [Caloplaca ligustica]
MFPIIVARLSLLFLFLQITVQTNIEFFDTPLAEDAHIFQKCRFFRSGDCCVPVDLIFPSTGRRVTFRPYKVVFEYFSKNALFVFANADNKSACGGPSVDAYVDPAAQSFVKGFVAQPDQRFSGAMFTQPNGPLPPGRIQYPWSIRFQNVEYYRSDADPLFYADLSGRRFLRAVPQSDPDPVDNGSVAES